MSVDDGIISCFGDSLWTTAGGGGTSSLTVPKALTLYANVAVENASRGGLDSTELAAMANAIPTQLTFSGNQVAASGNSTITSYTVDIVQNGGLYGSSAGYISGFVLGSDGVTQVAGNLRSNADTTYYFQRVTAGSAVSVVANTPFFTDFGERARGRRVAVMFGKNDIGAGFGPAAVDTIVSNFKAIMDYNQRTPKQLMLVSTITGHYGKGNEQVSQVTAITTASRNRLGAMFFDQNTPLVQNGIEIAIWLGLLPNDGTYPTSADNSSKAAGCPPDSFFNATETTHPNLIGRTVEGWITNAAFSAYFEGGT